MKEDHPQATSNYMVCYNVTRKKSRDPDLKWSKHTVRGIRCAIRQNLKLYGFILDECDRLYRVGRRVRGSKKKNNVDFTRKGFKCGLEELRDTKLALEIGVEQGDTKWADSLGLEVDSLIYIDFF